MTTTPTKEAIIGTFINGRNAQDDFLQLASNRGGTVFGWIDANGHLQGSLLQGTGIPGGSNTDVQFNNGGILGGSDNFTYASGKLNIQDTAAILTPLATFTVSGNGSGTAWEGFPALAELIVDTDVPFNLVFTNAMGTGNTGSSRGTFLGVEISGTGSNDVAGINYVLNGVSKHVILFGGSGSTTTDSALYFNGDGSVELGVNNTDSSQTEIAFTPNAGIQFYTDAQSPVEFTAGSPIQLDGMTSGSATIGVAAIAGTPNRFNFPIATASTGNMLVSDGGNPQQTSWSAGLVYTTSGTLNLGFQTGNGGRAYTVTAAGNASAGLTTYTTATIPPAGNPQPGQNITIAGFVAHTSNNG
jgi:hypothetical protein